MEDIGRFPQTAMIGFQSDSGQEGAHAHVLPNSTEYLQIRCHDSDQVKLITVKNQLITL